MSDRDDAQVLAALRSGDSAAFEALVDRLHGRLVRVARLFVSTEASAAEVVQDAWVAVLDGLDRFEGRSSLSTWITRIVINRAKTRGARDARMVPLSALGEPDADEPALPPERFDARGGWASSPGTWPDETPEQLVANAEAMALLEAELRLLPERQRAVVVLRDTLGWTAEEVCSVLELGESNQRVLLHRARSRLRARLELHFQRA